jgi:hypothetical protein
MWFAHRHSLLVLHGCGVVLQVLVGLERSEPVGDASGGTIEQCAVVALDHLDGVPITLASSNGSVVQITRASIVAAGICRALVHGPALPDRKWDVVGQR